MSKTHLGRPVIYTRERVLKLVRMVKQTGRSLKAILVSVNSKNHSKFKYVPLLVAMERLGLNLRRKK